MNIDQKILNSINNCSSSSFSILNPKTPSTSFYLKKRFLPVLTQTKSHPNPFHKRKPESSPNLFITQVLPKAKSGLPTFIKIFNICLKPEKDRKREEISIVAAWLQDISFLYPLSQAKLSALARAIRSRYHRKGEYLFKENEILNSFYFILNGEVLIFKAGLKCGNRHQREVVGENSFFNEERNLFGAVAGSEAHVFVIDTDEMMGIVEREPVHVNVILTRTLKSFPLFTSIPFLKVFAFCKKLKPLDTRKSLTIFKPGDPCKSFFILVYGQVNEKLGTYDGYEDWRVIPQGSFFGTREYILKSPHRTLASASSPSLIYEISDTYCRTFLHKMFIESSKQENIFEVPYHFDLQSDSSSIHDFPSVLNSFNRYP